MIDQQYRPDIDGLRALAVLAVIGYHLNPALIPGGFIGVDIFFVISGYLISLIILRERDLKTFSIAGFYSRRIRRLFPALLLVLSAALILGYFALFSDEYQQVGEHARVAMLFVLNFQLMDEAGYFDVAANSKPLLHLWSLAVEEQFYFVWPALLIFLQRLRINITATLSVIFLFSLIFALVYAQRHIEQVFFHPLARVWQLSTGALIAAWHFSRNTDTPPATLATRWRLEGTALASLLMIGWSLWVTDHQAINPNLYTLIPVLGAAGLILTKHATINNLLSSKAPVWIGLISYPLYLWHWPLLSYARILESGTPSNLALWAAIGIAFLLAWSTYRLIERPIRHSYHRWRAITVLVTGMLCLYIISSIIAENGLPNRTAIEYMKAADAQMQRQPRQDDSCLNLFKEREAPVYCRQSNPGRKMIAIIGDSHAHVLFPGLAELAIQQGYGTLLLANSGCPPLDGAVTGRNAAEHDACAQSIETILTAIERDSRLTAVVIATRGPQYITGTGYGPAEENYNYPPITPRHAAAAGTQSPANVFQKGLLQTIERLQPNSLNVSYLLQVPELGVTAKSCLGRPLTITTKSPGCTVPYSAYTTRMQDYRSLVKTIKQQTPALEIIDAEHLFCDNNTCTGYFDDQLLYADDNHLSVLGSRRIASLILKHIHL